MFGFHSSECFFLFIVLNVLFLVFLFFVFSAQKNLKRKFRYVLIMAINHLESCFVIQKQSNLWVSCGAWLTSIMVVLSLVSIIEELEHGKDSVLFLQLFFHEGAVSCQQGGVPAYL